MFVCDECHLHRGSSSQDTIYRRIYNINEDLMEFDSNGPGKLAIESPPFGHLGTNALGGISQASRTRRQSKPWARTGLENSRALRYCSLEVSVRISQCLFCPETLNVGHPVCGELDPESAVRGRRGRAARFVAAGEGRPSWPSAPVRSCGPQRPRHC